MKKTGKPRKTTKAKTAPQITSKRSDTRLMTLSEFGKISAIEGLHMSRDLLGTLKGLERKGAKERRSILAKKYGTAS
jgi:hypothetical protein